MKKHRSFLVIFSLFWSVIISIFDVSCARTLIGQWRSLGFKTVTGQILSSEITTNSDSDGTTYGARVRYQYSVNGRRYEKDRVRFGQSSDSDGEWARHTVNEYPPGTQCVVFYDPLLPTNAVLQTGISGRELFFALFLAPFNAVMVGMAWFTFASFRRPPMAGGAIIVFRENGVSVKFNPFSPALAALATFGGVTFISIFVVGFTAGFTPPTSLALLFWILAIVSSLTVYFWRRHALARRPMDLIIDTTRGTLTLRTTTLTGRAPASQDAKIAPHTPLVVELGDVRGVEVKERVRSGSESDSYSYVPVLILESKALAERLEYDLSEWSIAENAEAFSAWLREVLALTKPSGH